MVLNGTNGTSGVMTSDGGLPPYGMSERVAKMIEDMTPILCFSILHALCTILIRYMHYIFLHAGIHIIYQLQGSP